MLFLAGTETDTCAPQIFAPSLVPPDSCERSRVRPCRCERILVMQASQQRFGKHERTRRQSMSGFGPREHRRFLRWIRHARPDPPL